MGQVVGQKCQEYINLNTYEKTYMNGREDQLEKQKYVEILTIKLANGNRLQAIVELSIEVVEYAIRLLIDKEKWMKEKKAIVCFQ